MNDTRQKQSGPPKYKSRLPWVLLMIILAAGLGLNDRYHWIAWPWSPPPGVSLPQAPSVAKTPTPATIIDYEKIKADSDQALKSMIEKRKQEFGLKTSVDMVVKPEDAIIVGEETVSVADILSEIEALSESGNIDALPIIKPSSRITEEDLSAGGEDPPPPETPVADKPPPQTDYYGVYVVRKGDNLWDIHFAILKEYLARRNINISESADEMSTADGRSSGVSRILKYAESMVHIYNMKTRRLDSKLDMLEPESKVVVFNLSQVHRILGGIKGSHLDRIQFDGKELFFPEDKPDDET